MNYPKYCFLIFAMLLSVFSQAQKGVIKGKLILLEKGKKKTKNDFYVQINGASVREIFDIDSTLSFSIANLDTGIYSISVWDNNFGNRKVLQWQRVYNNELNVDIQFPNYCQYKSKWFHKRCPKCHKRNKVIPIVYGRLADSSWDDVEKGKFYPGGCRVKKCQPHWYCKRDKKSF